MPELVNDKCAFIVEKNDIIGLKNAIEECLEKSNEKINNISNEAILQSQKFTKEIYAQCFFDSLK